MFSSLDPIIRILVWTLVLAAIPAIAHADQVLFDFGKDFDLTGVQAQDVTPTKTMNGAVPALHIASRHDQEWPGITLVAPAGSWDLSAYGHVAIDVKNLDNSGVTVCCRVDNTGADGMSNCNTGTLTLKAGESGVLETTFTPRVPGRNDVKLFGMRGYPINSQVLGTIDTSKVTQLVVFTPKPDADHRFEISNIRAGGASTAIPVPPADKPFFPFIDTFGQYIHRDWPGKTHSLDELKASVAVEDADLAKHPGPENWDKYGGWNTGPVLHATGFFRTEKVQGKWWLVDPDGHLFFSHGIDCVCAEQSTPTAERDGWFQDFPGDQPEFKQFIIPRAFALHGHYAGQNVQAFSFDSATLLRKYGPTWKIAWAQVTQRRLRSWGLNTIANWSDRRVAAMDKTPYTATTGTGGKMIEGSQGYWGKFPDPFDPDFKEALSKRMANDPAKGDPWCIGYFVDNEMSWGDDTSLSLGAIQSPPDQAAKIAFVADLKAKYETIDRLNEAWGTQHASWDALLQSRQAPDPKKAHADLTTFYTRIAEQYFKTVRNAVKAAAPNQLYLGCRFAWVNTLAAEAAAKYCDIVSYNLYRKSVADFQFPGKADVPLIIGEFHFGALDRGMFHTGLVALTSQDERAKTYKDYLHSVLRSPAFVGCGWFQYQDEPTTGRVYDEENYQIGFIDCADTPYRETIEASREVGNEMYRYRMGE